MEQHVAIVHASVAVLRTDVTYGDALQWLMRLGVPDLHDERLRSVRDVLGRGTRVGIGVFGIGSRGALSRTWFGQKQLRNDDLRVRLISRPCARFARLHMASTSNVNVFVVLISSARGTMIEEWDATYSVRGSPSHSAIPPLTRRQIGAVDVELLGHGVPPGHRLDALDIAPVTELALGIASYDVVIEDAWHPIFVLGGRALLAYRRHCIRDKGQSISQTDRRLA